MLSTITAFQRYQEIRHRMPSARTNKPMQDINSLTDISNTVGAFVFDAFGVLNVGETLIKGADQRLLELRAQGNHIRILTNAASYDRAGAVSKFERLGLEIDPSEIITSRDAALDALTPGIWGVIAAPEDNLADIENETIRLEDDAAPYDMVDGFLFLSSSGWSKAKQKVLEAALQRRGRPVLIANADLVAPRENGFSLEPGYFGHLIVDAGIQDVRFFGKPFPEVYELAEKSLPDLAPQNIAMCGDTLHTDILGAAARNWRTVLVTKDGMFTGHDTQLFCDQSGIFPDWRVERI